MSLRLLEVSSSPGVVDDWHLRNESSPSVGINPPRTNRVHAGYLVDKEFENEMLYAKTWFKARDAFGRMNAAAGEASRVQKRLDAIQRKSLKLQNAAAKYFQSERQLRLLTEPKPTYVDPVYVLDAKEKAVISRTPRWKAPDPEKVRSLSNTTRAYKGHFTRLKKAFESTGLGTRRMKLLARSDQLNKALDVEFDRIANLPVVLAPATKLKLNGRIDQLKAKPSSIDARTGYAALTILRLTPDKEAAPFILTKIFQRLTQRGLYESVVNKEMQDAITDFASRAVLPKASAAERRSLLLKSNVQREVFDVYRQPIYTFMKDVLSFLHDSKEHKILPEQIKPRDARNIFKLFQHVAVFQRMAAREAKQQAKIPDPVQTVTVGDNSNPRRWFWQNPSSRPVRKILTSPLVRGHGIMTEKLDPNGKGEDGTRPLLFLMSIRGLGKDALGTLLQYVPRAPLHGDRRPGFSSLHLVSRSHPNVSRDANFLALANFKGGGDGRINKLTKYVYVRDENGKDVRVLRARIHEKRRYFDKRFIEKTRRKWLAHIAYERAKAKKAKELGVPLPRRSKRKRPVLFFIPVKVSEKYRALVAQAREGKRVDLHDLLKDKKVNASGASVIQPAHVPRVKMSAYPVISSRTHESKRKAKRIPGISDVWVADVLRRTAELALYRDKKVIKFLDELKGVPKSGVASQEKVKTVVASLFTYVYDKLPWYQQGHAGYWKVSDYLFRAMASHWVIEKRMKGIDKLKKLTESSPAELAELHNPAKYGLTQQRLQSELEEKRNKFATPTPRRSLLNWFGR